MIETIGYWRRYYKLHDCIGDARSDADVAQAPVVPVAPLAGHCDEYHYWDGEACVDARYHNL